MRVAVVTFPGSNCDEDAVHVVRHILGAEALAVWHKDVSLPQGTDFVILPGGFSYGDALRSGAIARFSPIMGAVADHARRGGFVLGICNGFQILLEAGLLPGAMLTNASRRFVCRRVRLEVMTDKTPFTRALKNGQVLEIPVAHHQGRYFAPQQILDQLRDENRIVLRYLDNPNGSLHDIAGIVNRERNIMGLMPHPERVSEMALGSEDGLGLFRSVVQASGAERKDG